MLCYNPKKLDEINDREESMETKSENEASISHSRVESNI